MRLIPSLQRSSWSWSYGRFNQHLSPLNVVIWIPLMVRCTWYNIIQKKCMIKFVSDLQQRCSFLWCTPVSSYNKTDRHNITEILLKVALSTRTLTPWQQPLWQLSYDSWIYQSVPTCITAIELLVWFPFFLFIYTLYQVIRCIQNTSFMQWSLSVTCGKSVLYSPGTHFFPTIKTDSYMYNILVTNIVESGVKHK